MNYSKSVLAIIFVGMTACSQAPKSAVNTEAESQEKSAGAPHAVSGKTAFWEIYKSAHAWAGDAEPLGLQSAEIPDIKNDTGKAAMWSATFGSPSRREARVFSYAVASHAPDIYQGVTVGRAIPWGGPSPDVMPFTDFAVDSDAAYKTASDAAGTWVKKHPGKEASLELGNATRFSGPVWYVLWGNNKGGGYAVLVNATTGAKITR